jgi:hypothetical protein
MIDFLISSGAIAWAFFSPAGSGENVMKSDGFPNAVAVALSIALAFAVSLFAAFAFGGLP